MNNPIIGLINTIILFILLRVKYDNSVIGKTIEIEKKRFTIFRYVKIKNKRNAKAYFLVRFKPIGITPKQNIMFSIFPMMIFMGFKGFCTKYWAVDYKTGLCQGFYEWENVEDAINYSKSIAMKYMTKRSDPKTIEYKIIDKSKNNIKYKIYE